MIVERVDHPDAGVTAILDRHYALMRSQSPEESCHVMTAEELRASGASLYCLRDGEKVLGIGALKPFGDDVELKSMHTLAEARGRGVARLILDHLIDVGRASDARAMYLETGSKDHHAAARTLYERAGFDYCPPFGDYVEDAETVFMCRTL